MPDLNVLQADALFHEMLGKVPYNRNKVYLQIKTKDCVIYMPSRFPHDNRAANIEKEHWQRIIDLAKY